MFFSVLEQLLKEKGIPASKMLADCKLGKNQYTYWRKNGNVPGGATLQKIADYFGVSVDYLLGKTEQKEKPVGVPDGLWEKISADPQKMQLATWLASLSDTDFERVRKLMEAALLLPPE